MHTINLPGPFDGKELHLWLIRLMYLNTEINPWLYVILRRESVRKFFVMISQCWRRFCTKENNDAHENIIDFAVYKWKILMYAIISMWRVQLVTLTSPMNKQVEYLIYVYSCVFILHLFRKRNCIKYSVDL